jgi:hypothetical protein
VTTQPDAIEDLEEREEVLVSTITIAQAFDQSWSELPTFVLLHRQMLDCGKG